MADLQFRIEQSGQHVLDRSNTTSIRQVDTEGPRYLEFEKWWGNPVLLNGGEIQFIVDELFVGNRLATGEVVIDGKPIDLRKIKSPIIVFCSFGDDITPPQQALDWILDLYKDVDDVIASGQTIALFAASEHRPSRHFRLRQGREKRA